LKGKSNEELYAQNLTRRSTVCEVFLSLQTILFISLCSFTNCMCFCRLIVNLSFPMFLVVYILPLEACIENNDFLTFLLQNKYNIYWTTIARYCIMYVDSYCFQFCFNPLAPFVTETYGSPDVPLANHPHSPELEFINSLTGLNYCFHLNFYPLVPFVTETYGSPDVPLVNHPY
jgi:hypothetical protein